MNIVLLPAVIADREILGLSRPGECGSTLSGSPFICAIGSAICDALTAGKYQRRSTGLSKHLHTGLEALISHGVTTTRGAGLWADTGIDPTVGTAKDVSPNLLDHGVLVKDTHGQALRLVPPLVTTEDKIGLIMHGFRVVLEQRLTRHV